MRIDVLNGVNLDLLGRRDVAHLRQRRRCRISRRRIYAVGARARPAGSLPPDQSRGRVRRVLHHALGDRGRPDRQSRRLDALLVGDPRRARAVRGPVRRSAPLGYRQPGGVAAASPCSRDSAACAIVGKGFDGYRRGAGAARRTPRMSRLERLAARLDRAAARHVRRQRPLPDGLRELELPRCSSSRAARRRSTPISATRRRRRPSRRLVRADATRPGERRSPSCSRAAGSRSRPPASPTTLRDARRGGGIELDAVARRRRAAASGQGSSGARRDPARVRRSRTRSTLALADGALHRTHRARSRLVDRARVPRAGRRGPRVRASSPPGERREAARTSG